MNDYTSLQVSNLLRSRPGYVPGFGKILFSPLSHFVRNYFTRRGYRDGMQGFLLAVLDSLYALALYAKLWEYRTATRRTGDPPRRHGRDPGHETAVRRVSSAPRHTVPAASMTLVVAVYNAVRPLGLIFDALDRQTCVDFEVVVADDGSGPAIAELVELRNAASRYSGLPRLACRPRLPEERHPQPGHRGRPIGLPRLHRRGLSPPPQVPGGPCAPRRTGGGPLREEGEPRGGDLRRGSRRSVRDGSFEKISLALLVGRPEGQERLDRGRRQRRRTRCCGGCSIPASRRSSAAISRSTASGWSASTDSTKNTAAPASGRTPTWPSGWDSPARR